MNKNQNNSNEFKFILDPPKIEHNKALNINLIKTLDFGESIIKFSKKILDLKDIDYTYFYRNIETLKMQNIGSLVGENTRAGYSVKCNIIAYKDFLEYCELCHELLHLSCSIFDSWRNVEFCGFSQINYNSNVKLCVAINEGYTEHLNEKLFGINTNAYLIEKSFAKSIESIIGSDKMKKMFFKASLKELVLELSKYSSIDETMNFMQTVDYISNKANILIKTTFDKENYNLLKMCANYLVSTFLNKVNIELNEGIINKDEYNEKLENYIDTLGVIDVYRNEEIYLFRFIDKLVISKILKKKLKEKK